MRDEIVKLQELNKQKAKINKLMNFLNEDDLVEKADIFFNNMQYTDKEMQFLALDDFTKLLITRFVEKEQEEIDGDNISLITLILFDNYHGISRDQIFLRLITPIARENDPEFKESKYKITEQPELTHYIQESKENIVLFSESLSTIRASLDCEQYSLIPGVSSLAYLKEKSAGMMRVIASISSAFIKDNDVKNSEEKEKEWDNFLVESFKKIDGAITDNTKSFMKTMEELMWDLSTYLIAFPYNHKKIHDRQQKVEALMEQICLEYHSSDSSKMGEDIFLLNKKVENLQKLFFEYSTERRGKNFNNIVKVAIGNLQKIKDNFPENCPKKERWFDNEIDRRYKDKNDNNENELLQPAVMRKKLYSVPFKVFIQKRHEFQNALDKSSVVNQFVQFLKDLFIKTDIMIKSLKAEKLFHGIPKKLEGKNCFAYFKELKREAKKTVVEQSRQLQSILKKTKKRKNALLGEASIGDVSQHLFLAPPSPSAPKKSALVGMPAQILKR